MQSCVGFLFCFRHARAHLQALSNTPFWQTPHNYNGDRLQERHRRERKVRICRKLETVLLHHPQHASPQENKRLFPTLISDGTASAVWETCRRRRRCPNFLSAPLRPTANPSSSSSFSTPEHHSQTASSLGGAQKMPEYRGWWWNHADRARLVWFESGTPRERVIAARTGCDRSRSEDGLRERDYEDRGSSWSEQL